MENRDQNWLVAYMYDNGRIDDTDKILLEELIKDSRISITELAKKAHISRPTVKERMDQLRKKGIINGFTTSINFDKCGLTVAAFLLVGYDTSKEEQGSSQDTVARALSRIPFVRKVNIITGSNDFLVEIYIDHMNSLGDLIMYDIRKIPGVGNTVTMNSFKEYRNGYEMKARTT